MGFSKPRSALLWAVGGVHFALCAPPLGVLARIFGPKRVDPVTRALARNVMRLAGARVTVVAAPGVAAAAPCVFVSNHVSLFDPFTLCPALPVYTRALELESHFDIPVYGWMMKSLGNVPVPDAKTPGALRRMWDGARAALADGTSLMVFPEGKRTRDGKLNPFRDGAFRLAIDAGVPVVPVSMAGAFEHHHRGTWILTPADIVVTVHAPIPTKRLSKEDAGALRDRARGVISACLREPAS